MNFVVPQCEPSLLRVSAESPCHTSSKPHSAKMTSTYPTDPQQFGIHFSDKVTAGNNKLLARIDSKSIAKASSVSGSIYFYVAIRGDDGLGKEELINDPSALEAATETLGIEIRHENKHHRWSAGLPHAFKILEFAATHLKQSNNIASGNIGVNAELKWRDDQGLESIIHLSQGKDSVDWQVTRYL